MEPMTRRRLLTVLAMAPAASLVAGGALALPQPRPDKVAVIERSIDIAARYYSIPIEKLVSPLRWNAAVRGRQRVTYLAFRLSGASLTELGPYFGGRDWMTMRYSVLNVHNQTLKNPALMPELQGLARIIDAERASKVAWHDQPRLRRL